MTGRRRVARAVAFAAVVAGTSVAAHDLAGGMLPGVRVVLLVAAVALAAGWLLGARTRSVPVVAAAAVAGQLGAHVAFALSMQATAGSARASALHAVLCGHGHVSAATHVTGLPAPQGPGAWSAAAMTAAHVVAGVVVLLAVRHGEHVAAVVLAAVRRAVAFALPRPAPVPRRRRVLRSNPVVRRAQVLRAAGLALRGPPVVWS